MIVSKAWKLPIVLIAAICVLLSFYSPILININSTFFGIQGDGIKNYYTIWYHVLYGNSLLHFDGLNYPFGEHIIFTDAQPLIAFILISLKEIFPDIGSIVPGILNSLMLLSVVLGVFFSYKILDHFKTNFWIALFGSILITMLSPQMDRLLGHYSLSYVCFLPILIYLLILFSEGKKYVYSLIICLTVTVFSFIHLYYLFISGALIGFYFLITIISDRKYLNGIIHFLFQIGVPLLVLFFFIYSTDHILDRPEAPVGFLKYTSQLAGVFLSMESPIIEYVIVDLLGLRTLVYEGRSYLGIIAGFVLPIAGFLLLKKKVVISRTIKILLFASILILFLSFGYPFHWIPSDVLDNIGPLKQFRSLGRLAWVFYFIANYFVFISIGYIVDRVRMRPFIKGALILLLVLGGIELYQKNVKLSHTINNQILIGNASLDDLKSQNFQAIIPIPFFHVGSEMVGKPQQEDTYSASLLWSIETGIPIYSNMLSRTSYAQTIATYQSLFGSKEDANDGNNLEPFLVIVSDTTDLHYRDKQLSKSGNVIGKYRDCTFYKLDSIPNSSYSEIENPIFESSNFSNLNQEILADSGLYRFAIKIVIPPKNIGFFEYTLEILGSNTITKYFLNEELVHVDEHYFYFEKIVYSETKNIEFSIYPKQNNIQISNLKVDKVIPL
jgi:hypothetical protein